MTFSVRVISLFAFMFLAHVPEVASAQTLPDVYAKFPVPMNEKILKVPGDPQRPVMLEVTLYTPDGPGPFPLVVFNHGANKNTGIQNESERYRFTWPALYFLSRGYAVALPMMRGFAGSGGKAEQDGCNLVLMGQNNAKDIEAVINYFKSQPYINGRQVIVSGQSYGGFNALHVGLFNDPDVKGIIGFSAGLRISTCKRMEGALITDFAYVGGGVKIPVIFFYGDNDIILPKSLWQSMVDSYRRAGGKAELVSYGSFMNDAHQLLSHREGFDLWIPKVDIFLAKVGLPSHMQYPQYLPSQSPPPSGYAKIGDVQAVPYLNEKGRAVYRQYLAKPAPKALVIMRNGALDAEIGGFDPLGLALKKCHEAHKPCELYAVDNNVVWVKPK